MPGRSVLHRLRRKPPRDKGGFRRSDHEAARKAYEDALPLFRKVGEVPGEANCIKKLKQLEEKK